MIRMDPVFQTPRVIVLAATNKGGLIDLHYHRAADEIVVAVKGQCEQYIDGKWVVMKAGDIHYNPKGVIHGTRLVGNEPFYALSIFTAPPPGGNDRVFLNSDITTAKPGAVVGDWSLLDTQFKKGALFNMDDWYAKNPPEAGKNHAQRSGNGDHARPIDDRSVACTWGSLSRVRRRNHLLL